MTAAEMLERLVGFATVSRDSNLDLIAFFDGGGRVSVAFDHDKVAFDRDAPGVDVELREQPGDGDRGAQLVRVAVEGDRQIGLSIPNGASSDCNFRSPASRMCAGSVTPGSGRAAASFMTRS